MSIGMRLCQAVKYDLKALYTYYLERLAYKFPHISLVDMPGDIEIMHNTYCKPNNPALDVKSSKPRGPATSKANVAHAARSVTPAEMLSGDADLCTPVAARLGQPM